jgi:hypothetical protein
MDWIGCEMNLWWTEVARSGLVTLDSDLMYDLFDWATKSVLPLFETQRPGPRNRIQVPVTLEDFLYSEAFNYEIRAVEDKFIPGHIQRQEIQEAQGLSEFGQDFVLFKTQSQSVYPAKVQICSEKTDDVPDFPNAQPHRVCVDGQILVFKYADRSSLRHTINASEKYLRIADLGPNIRTSRLYGIVAGDDNPLI